MATQRIEDPNRAELEWVAAHVELAANLAAGHSGAGVSLPTVEDLDALWAAWLAESGRAEEANDIINAVGLAFGQRLVEDLGMRWAVLTDDLGSEMAVHEPLCDLLPANLVAKRWESHETGFLRPVFDEVAARVKDLRG
jgi:hypothetical protein